MQICLVDQRREWPDAYRNNREKGPFDDDFSQFDIKSNILLVCAIWINTKYAEPEIAI